MRVWDTTGIPRADGRVGRQSPYTHSPRRGLLVKVAALESCSRNTVISSLYLAMSAPSSSVSFTSARTRMRLAREANLSVLCVSSRQLTEAEMEQMTAMSAFPSSAGCRKRVSFESLCEQAARV